MLSKAAALGKIHKESKLVATNENDEDEEVDDDVPMDQAEKQSSNAITANGNGDGEQQVSSDNTESEMALHVWARDPERERDKIMGFFMIAGQPIPRDIFHSVMSFIPAFPYYFMLRSVCSQWLYEFQEQIYDNVKSLDLVDDGRPKFYMRDNQLVQFKPIGATGKGCRLNTSDPMNEYYNRSPVFKFLGNVFSNVTHLRIGWASFYSRHYSSSCIPTLLPLLKQLETVDILGVRQNYYRRPVWGSENTVTDAEVVAIARSLPTSVKNLNFIGVGLPHSESLSCLKYFSEKGRESLP